MGISTLPVIKTTGKVWTAYSTPSYASLSGARTTETNTSASTQVYYVGGLYIFGTTNGVIGYSTDTKNWNYQVILPTAQRINGIAYNGTTWVVVGGNNYCYSGTPGGTWTARTSQISGVLSINDVKWVAGSINLFVLIGDQSAASNSISTSSDGITWTGRYSSGDNVYSLAVNTAQSVIVVGTDKSTASQQAVYSTNGTSWTFCPVTTSAVTANYIYYMPHVDKFAATNVTYRRSSASVGTAWNTATAEKQNLFNVIVANNSTSTYLQHALPIWDSANRKYYVADSSSSRGQFFASLYTFNATDLQTRFDTGVENYYGWSLDKTEVLPINQANAFPNTGPAVTSIPYMGYGNGIWVAVTTGNTWNANNNTTFTVFSTATS